MKRLTALLIAITIFLIPCLTACEQDDEIPYVVLSKANVILSVGDEYTMGAGIYPDKYSELPIEWSTSNPSVATCTNGRINALSEGTSVIMASVNGGNAFSATVTVKDTVRNHANMLIGESLTIAESQYNTLFSGDVTWSTSDPTVAQCVDGVISACSTGEAVIRVSQGSDVVSMYSVSVFEDVESMVAFGAPELPVTLSYMSGKTAVEVLEFTYTVSEDASLAADRLMVTFAVNYRKTDDISGSQSKNTTGFYIELYSDETGYCTTYTVKSEYLFVGQSATFSTNFIADVSNGMRHFNIVLVPIEQ